MDILNLFLLDVLCILNWEIPLRRRVITGNSFYFFRSKIVIGLSYLSYLLIKLYDFWRRSLLKPLKISNFFCLSFAIKIFYTKLILGSPRLWIFCCAIWPSLKSKFNFKTSENRLDEKKNILKKFLCITNSVFKVVLCVFGKKNITEWSQNCKKISYLFSKMFQNAFLWIEIRFWEIGITTWQFFFFDLVIGINT